MNTCAHAARPEARGIKRRGVPFAAAGTRLRRPQCGHLISASDISASWLSGGAQVADDQVRLRVVDPHDGTVLNGPGDQSARRAQAVCDHSHSAGEAERRLAAIPDEPTVYYDPAKPSEGYLELHTPTIGQWFIAVGCAAVLLPPLLVLGAS